MEEEKNVNDKINEDELAMNSMQKTVSKRAATTKKANNKKKEEEIEVEPTKTKSKVATKKTTTAKKPGRKKKEEEIEVEPIKTKSKATAQKENTTKNISNDEEEGTEEIEAELIETKSKATAQEETTTKNISNDEREEKEEIEAKPMETKSKVATMKIMSNEQTIKTDTIKTDKSIDDKVGVEQLVSNKLGADSKKIENLKADGNTEKVQNNNKIVSNNSNSDEEVLEQENLIAQVENVSEQTEVNDGLKNIELIKSNNNLMDSKNLKEDQLEAIKKEIKNNKKSNSSKNKKKLKYNEIFINTIIFIIIQIYFIIVMLGTLQVNTIIYITDLKVMILLEAISSIIMFEVAYKKESTVLTFHGLEILGLGISTVVILNLYSRQSPYLNYAFIGIIAIFLIYYLIKILCISLRKNVK